MNITDLFPREALDEMLTEGFVKVQQHERHDLLIYNYTAKAQYSRTWNDVTTQCRGLITDLNGRLVARGFRKFFNLGELTDDEVPAGPFQILEKIDGSLGIAYATGEGVHIATRGSFHSEQAQHATDLLQDRYPHWKPRPDLTYLFEIIYPANRIVVDYGDTDDLILLDVLDTATGRSVVHEVMSSWPGRTVREFPQASITDLLAWDQPKNTEGYVLRFDSGKRVKVKHDEYVRLHRLVTGVSTRTIWEYLSTGKAMTELLDAVPDEFYEWVKTTTKDLQRQHDEVLEAATLAYNRAYGSVKDRYPDDQLRKAFAAEAVKSEYRATLFAMYDGKDVASLIWRGLKPAADRPFAAQSEDSA